MLEKVMKYMQNWHMVEQRDKVIVGVSGGADSVCLLFVLMEMQKKIPFEIVAVHVNHSLRGADADADETYVKTLCGNYGIPCVCYKENVELIAKKRKQSTEEAGREVRRACFENTAALYGGTKIALAHHKNDNVETFMMNLARGTGLKGLGGIAPVKGNVIRPLLCAERGEIESFLKERGIAYCTDASNQTDAYTRNRIRNHVIPYLEKEVNSNAVSHMNETMKHLREVQAFLQEQVLMYFEKCVSVKEGRYLVDKEQYKMVPQVVRNFMLKEVLVRAAGYEKDIEAVHVEILGELLENQVGRKVDLPYDVEAKRGYQGIEIFKKTKVCAEENEAQTVMLEPNQEEIIHWGDKTIYCRVFERKEDILYSEKNNTNWFNYDIMKRMLSFRTREPGDYITIHSTGQTQKLKSYFVNEKIPGEERGKILLVADGSHVLWVVGHRRGCAYQITKNTKYVLEIKIDEGEKL